ncbi:MAG: sigma-70 family RNA polymerase sigma factor [Clostridiales bacterium]|nr:sigma-70 family RNA polymerase sigma factor [Clostridiales bacterium]
MFLVSSVSNQKPLLEEIVEKYSDMVLRLATIRTKNKHYAEDIYSDVFLRLIKNYDKLRDENHVKAWLIRVTINCTNTYMKKMSRDNLPLPDNIPSFSEPVFSEVYQAVASLPDKYRTVIHMHFYDGLAVKEISRLLAQTESATKMQLKRAKEKLKVILGDDFNDK